MAAYSQAFQRDSSSYGSNCQVNLNVSNPARYFVVPVLFWEAAGKKHQLLLNTSAGEQVLWFYVDTPTSVTGSLSCSDAVEEYQLNLNQGWNTVLMKGSIIDNKRSAFFSMPDTAVVYQWSTVELTDLGTP